MIGGTQMFRHHAYFIQHRHERGIAVPAGDKVKMHMFPYAGTGGFTYVDLDTPLLLASEPLQGGLIYENDVIKVAHIKEGHGVTPV